MYRKVLKQHNRNIFLNFVTVILRRRYLFVIDRPLLRVLHKNACVSKQARILGDTNTFIYPGGEEGRGNGGVMTAGFNVLKLLMSSLDILHVV